MPLLVSRFLLEVVLMDYFFHTAFTAFIDAFTPRFKVFKWRERQFA